ncbi:hypothetical protein LWT83_23955, partial [Enterobacter hormaechei]|nr:hypothetical protein [Enterobacter hormaechei]
MTQQRQAKYRRDYRAPDYTISDIELDVNLDADNTEITAISQIKRLSHEITPLVLDGEDLTLKSLHVNGQPWVHYHEQG